MGGTEYKCVATNKRKSKKRSFRGNKYTKSQGGTEDMSIADQVDGNGSAVISGEQSTASSAPVNVLNSSASKIDLSYYDSKEDNENYNKGDTDRTDDASSSTSSTHKTSSNINTKCMYMLTDISIFLELFHLVGRCPVCSGQIDVTVDFTAKKGLAQKVMLNCTGTSDCDWAYSSYLSTSVKSDERSRFDINIRSLRVSRNSKRSHSY